MITGLHFDFPSEELKQRLAERIQHHKDRQEFYEKQAGSLQAGGAEAMEYTGGDPVKALQDKARQHQNRGELFRIFHDHIIPGEVYRLEEKDLLALDLISRAW